MASRRAAGPAKQLFTGFKASQRLQQPCLARGMATTTQQGPNATLAQTHIDAHLDSAPTEPILKDQVAVPPPNTRAPAPAALRQPSNSKSHNPFITPTQCTLYDFPSMEPRNFVSYPSTHLAVPLRKDLLHRAVIYEGDMTRQGTASTKWRSEVHGSNRKVRPQKGTGSARLGDKKSPMIKGGGVAFGPKPRDFSTELPRKIYDRAWRTALSYRYAKGELVLVDGEIDIDVADGSLERYLRDVLAWQNMGRAGGRTLFVTAERRHNLFDALQGENMGRQARALEVEHVDVKDMLELGRVVMEKEALEKLLLDHESDLVPVERLWRRFSKRRDGLVPYEV